MCLLTSRMIWIRSCLLLLVLVCSVSCGSTSRLADARAGGAAVIALPPPGQSLAMTAPQASLSNSLSTGTDGPIVPDAPPEIQAIIDQMTVSGFRNRVVTLSTSFGTRLYGTPGNIQAVNHIKSFFQDTLGLETTLHYFGSGGPNVVGTLLAGSAANEDIIVVGAHLDTWPAESPGADDDASGVAAVMEIARAMAQYQYNHTIVFVAFNSEEQGLVGSNAYANMLFMQNTSVALVCNFDMVLWNNPEAPADEKLDIVHNGGASGAFASEAASLGQAWLDAPIKPFYAPGWTMSDHSPFWSRGYPAVWFFESGGLGNNKIHSSQDRWNDPQYSYEQGCMAARTAAAALADFATIVSTQPGFPAAAFVAPTPQGYVNPSAQMPLVLAINDTDHDVNRVELSINGGGWFDASAGLNATHCTYFWNASTAYGSVNLRAHIYDTAGWITRANRNFVIDRGVTCAIIAPLPGEVITQGTPYLIRVNATDLDGRPLSNAQVRVNASTWNPMMPAGSGQYTYNWTAAGRGSVIIEAWVVDQNGRSNTSQVTATVFAYAPVVSSVAWTPLQPTDADRIRVTAQVYQDPRGTGIQMVLVFYSVNGRPWAARLMTATSATEYAGTLDPLPLASAVRFYVQAYDNIGNIVRDDNGGLYYGFTVATNPVRLLIVGGGIAAIASALAASWFTLRKGRHRSRH